MLTRTFLLSVLRYEPTTGIFVWIKATTKKRVVGKRAGSIRPDGYLMLGLLGKDYLLHRLAWFYITGLWPALDTDHINGVRSDNRWKNLREASRSANMQNVHRARKDSSTGLQGVKPSRGRFYARITANGHVYGLGTFDTAAQAHSAYRIAKEKLHARRA